MRRAVITLAAAALLLAAVATRAGKAPAYCETDTECEERNP